ncbi:g/t mismatch-specific thymine DNA glycosylase [Anaeramoeba flamelloides]|uniref:G/t mismatch-specific thymine DNA glycosylase n=1 Tax=Anaeramoeba flamelloides TaxID=1746091 RepID=A0ABQ8ZC55_9EUKA|nr:g/t mismatch-specific thymine DNA glycosylase [Anaeramoeba flamelloides]
MSNNKRKRKQLSNGKELPPKDKNKKARVTGSETQTDLSHPFQPIVNKNSKVLILGTFPSIKSFENTIYYGHPQNAFWKILFELFGVDSTKYGKDTARLNKARRKLADNKGIAIWDCIGAAQRTKKNSLDSSLNVQKPNDIPGLLKKYPKIKAICLTSKATLTLFKRHFKNISLPKHVLPSPSPMYFRMSYSEKRDKYKEIFEEVGLLSGGDPKKKSKEEKKKPKKEKKKRSKNKSEKEKKKKKKEKEKRNKKKSEKEKKKKPDKMKKKKEKEKKKEKKKEKEKEKEKRKKKNEKTTKDNKKKNCTSIKNNKQQSVTGSETQTDLSHPFQPIVNKNSRVLILGTFPSIKSFENTIYYGHPQNAFWKILFELFGVDSTKYGKDTARLNKARRKLADNKGIAIWDCIGAAQRTKKNSLDSSLNVQKPNDIPGLLKKYPKIKAICLTSKATLTLFKRHFKNISLPKHVLPSPSPMYFQMSYSEKRDKYKEIFEEVGLL